MADADLVYACLTAHDQHIGGLDDRTADALARVIATRHYLGADDGYAFISTGAIPDNPHHLWVRTAPADLDTAPHDRRPLDYLAGYLLRHAGRGPVPGWTALWLRPSPGRRSCPAWTRPLRIVGDGHGGSTEVELDRSHDLVHRPHLTEVATYLLDHDLILPSSWPGLGPDTWLSAPPRPDGDADCEVECSAHPDPATFTDREWRAVLAAVLDRAKARYA